MISTTERCETILIKRITHVEVKTEIHEGNIQRIKLKRTNFFFIKETKIKLIIPMAYTSTFPNKLYFCKNCIMKKLIIDVINKIFSYPLYHKRHISIRSLITLLNNLKRNTSF